MKYDNYIGIDPDVDKSGVAMLDISTGIINVTNLSFFEVCDYLRSVKSTEVHLGETALVRIECGHLNKGNWHIEQAKKVYLSSVGNHSLKLDKAIRAAAKIGGGAIENHRISKLLIELCKMLQLPYEQVKPERSKVNAEVFKRLSGVTGRTNQEQRDAGMLVVGFK